MASENKTNSRRSSRRDIYNPRQFDEEIHQSIEDIYDTIEQQNKKKSRHNSGNMDLRLDGTQKLVEVLFEQEEKGDSSPVDWVGILPIKFMYIEHIIQKYNLNCTSPTLDNATGMASSSGLIFNIHDDAKEFEKAKPKSNKIISDFAKNLVACMNNNKNQKLVPVQLKLQFSDSTAHANLLLVRPNLGVVEHFEPHGPSLNHDSRMKSVNRISQINQNIRFFTECLNREQKRVKYKAVLSHLTCPYLEGAYYGVQTLESRYKDKTKHEQNGGYCLAWSYFVLELVLMNPDNTLRYVQESVLRYLKVRYMKTYYSKPNETPSSQVIQSILRSIIRSYSRHIFETILKFTNFFYGRAFRTITGINNFLKKSGTDGDNIRRFKERFGMYLKITKLIEDENIKSLDDVQTRIHNEIESESGKTIFNDIHVRKKIAMVNDIIKRMKKNPNLKSTKTNSTRKSTIPFNKFDFGIRPNNKNQPLVFRLKETRENILQKKIETMQAKAEREKKECDELRKTLRKKGEEIILLKNENDDLKKERNTLSLKIKNKNNFTRKNRNNTNKLSQNINSMKI